ERIKEEMEENPALEYADASQEEDDYQLDSPADNKEEGELDDVELTSDTAEKVELDDFLRDEDEGDYGRYGDDYYSGDKEEKTIPVRVETSFHEHLLNQLSLLDLNDEQQIIAEQIIGSIDEDGYLRR